MISKAQQEEIQLLRGQTHQTRRATVPALEEILFEGIPVLDHGFIRVIDYMGDDNAIVQAARVSYGTGTKKVSEDRGLIHYLMRHRHSTPFEMCEIKLHVKLPIFVARQWIRHRTANVNEYSARYSIMEKEFYLPHPENLAVQATDNRQGRGGILSPQEAERVIQMLKEDAERCHEHYEMLLKEESGQAGSTQAGAQEPFLEQGLARELARMNLTVNFYTQWYWKIDLHNFMHFLSLRADPHAQYEIRAYADAMIQVLKRWVPFCYEAFEEYRLHGVHVSAKALGVIKKMLSGETVTQEQSGMTKREWSETMALLDNR